MPVYAKIAPRDGVAAILDANGSMQSVYDINGDLAPERFPFVESCHDFEMAIVEVEDSSAAIELLRQKSDACMALDMVLMLFDDDISHSTKVRLSVELQALLAVASISNQVQDILFARPLPPSANVNTARQAIKGKAVTAAFVEQLIELQPQIGRLHDAWLNLDKESLLAGANADRIFAYMSSTGVFRRLAVEAKDQGSLKSLSGELVLATGQHGSQRIDPRDLLAYIRELEKLIPSGTAKPLGIRSTAAAQKTPLAPVPPVIALRAHESGRDSYDAALREVDKIADLYANGKDPAASRFLEELITRLGVHEFGQSYIVKSLCNVSSRVGGRGRPDISFRCLERALQFPAGIDAKLYLDIGKGLSTLRRYADAVKCFELARKLDDGSRGDEILLAEIRAQREIGNYHRAIAELQDPKLGDPPIFSYSVQKTVITDQLRIGAVKYLSSRPLVENLAGLLPSANLTLDLPSRLADDLAKGKLDVALIPSVEYLQTHGYEVISDACVASRGEVLSAKLFCRVHPGNIRTLAIDEGSRTCAALTKVILSERYGVIPKTEPLRIDSTTVDSRADAILLIGDRALNDPKESFVEVIDLGQFWYDWTGLPFVFAVWVARQESNTGGVDVVLSRARDLGMARISEIARDEATKLGVSEELAFNYLTKNMHYHLTSAERSGLRLFWELAAQHQLVKPNIDIVFREFGADVESGVQRFPLKTEVF